MVREYYVEQVTEMSEQELQAIFQAIDPPVCLLGGWAVHLHVTPGFQQEYGRAYIGSRDIDIGVHVDPNWTAAELKEQPVGTSLQRIEDLGYMRSRFGFVQYFNRETGSKISEAASQDLPLYEVFEMFVDLLPDTTELDSFEEAFGFRPPAEPSLQRVFRNEQATPLADHVSWMVPNDVLIADPAVLAVMKIRALPQRDKEQKRVKDLADLHALLWYVQDYAEMQAQVHDLAATDELETLYDLTDDELVVAAGTLLQVEIELIRASIDRLVR
jgi:hypothetical protein